MNDLINPDFQTDVHSNDKPISVDKLQELVEKEEPYLRGMFRRNGFITSREYFFISYANFDTYKNCGMDERVYKSIIKNDDEKKMSMENLNYMQQHLRAETRNDEIKLAFYARNSNECALVDANRFNKIEIHEILSECFL